MAQALTLKVNSKAKPATINNKNDIFVGEYNDILINLANCCKPVKGDEIVGYRYKWFYRSFH